MSSVLCVCLCSTDRNDFSDDSLKVTFEAGSILSSYVSIDIVDDSIMEENETFICVILKSTQFEKDDLLTEDPDVATIAILDSDCKCTLSSFTRTPHWSCQFVCSSAVHASGSLAVSSVLVYAPVTVCSCCVQWLWKCMCMYITDRCVLGTYHQYIP